MNWIEFHANLRDHWKIDRLKDILKVPYTQALGIMGCLWTWAADQAQNGDLSRFTDTEIARASRYESPSEGFKDTLKKCGLIDPNGKIHDWNRHGIRVLKSSRKRQKEYRKTLRNGSITKTQLSRPSNLSIPSNLSNLSDNNPPIPQGDKFGQIWKKYPNKDGMKAALRAFKASVKSEQDWEAIQVALENYLKTDRVQKGFIKNGSTWFNNWRDWAVSEENKSKLTALAESVNAMP